MLKAIIIDDEEDGRNNLSALLKKHCLAIEVIATADSAKKGAEQIKNHHPDLIFLDVEMPNGSGFDLLEQLNGNIDFEVIFTTAYDQYALRAIKFTALDYLLKPIGAKELKAAVEKVEKRKNSHLQQKSLDALLHNQKTISVINKKVALPAQDGLVFAELNEIIRCEADNTYTTFHLTDKSKVMTSRNIGEYEELLSDYRFFRVHKSHLINLLHIKKYVKGLGGYVIMKDGSEIEVSRRNKDELLQRLSAL